MSTERWPLTRHFRHLDDLHDGFGKSIMCCEVRDFIGDVALDRLADAFVEKLRMGGRIEIAIRVRRLVKDVDVSVLRRLAFDRREHCGRRRFEHAPIRVEIP